VPTSLVYTFFTSIVAATFLMWCVDFCSVIFMSSAALPFDVVIQVGFVSAALVSPFAWALRKWQPVAFGAWVAFLINVVLGLTLYKANADRGRAAEAVIGAICITVGAFLLGFVASKAAHYFRARFPSDWPRLSPHVRAR
jgi:hypothetical protein